MNRKIFLVVFVIGLLAVVIGIQQTFTGKVILVDDSPYDFRVFTQAVCEETNSKKTCVDKIFYSCEGSVNPLEGDLAVCKNRSIHIGKVSLGSLEILKE